MSCSVGHIQGQAGKAEAEVQSTGLVERGEGCRKQN